MKKNAILTSVIATCCALSLNTATDAMGGFEEDLGHVNFVFGAKTLDNKLKVSNPLTEVDATTNAQTAAGLTAADNVNSLEVGSATYKTAGNNLGQSVELDLGAQTQFGLDFDVKVDNYLMPFNLAFGYFKSSGQLVDDSFTQQLNSVTTVAGAGSFTTVDTATHTHFDRSTKLTTEQQAAYDAGRYASGTGVLLTDPNESGGFDNNGTALSGDALAAYNASKATIDINRNILSSDEARTKAAQRDITVSSASLKPEARVESNELRFGARKYKDFANGISIFYGFGLAAIDYSVEGKYVENGQQEVIARVGADASDAVTIENIALTGVATASSKITAPVTLGVDEAVVAEVDAADVVATGGLTRDLGNGRTVAVAEAQNFGTGAVATVTQANPAIAKSTARFAPDARLVNFSQSASTLGFYGEIATLYKLADNFHVGAKLDMSAGSVTLKNQATGEDEDIQVGGMNYAVFAGVSF